MEICCIINHAITDDTVNTFKNRLDIFWFNQYVLCDYTVRSTWHRKPHYRVVIL